MTRLPAVFVVFAMMSCAEGSRQTGDPRLELEDDEAAGAPIDARRAADTGAPGTGTDAARDSAARTTDGPSGDARQDPVPTGKTYVFASASRPNIKAYAADLSTGVLTDRGNGGLTVYGGYMVADAARKRVYALTDQLEQRIAAFSVNGDTGELTLINAVSTSPGSSAPFISLHRSGKWLFTAHYRSGHVVVHPVADNGTVGASVDSHLAGLHAHSVISDRSGKFVFVPCVATNYVAQYVFDVNTGKLTPNNPPTVTTRTWVGPRHIAFHPTKDFAYTQNETTGTMTAYTYDAVRGTLEAIQTVSTVPDGFAENAGAHVEVHPNGKFVYGSNRKHGSIAVFSIDQTTGRLTFVDWDRAAGGTDYYQLDRTGNYLLGSSGSGLNVVTIDPTTGRLTRKASTPLVGAGAVLLLTVD